MEAKIHEQAYAAGMAAANETRPPVMVVGTPTTPLGNDIDYEKKVYVVPEGPCGFAWVTVKPANSRFAKYLVREGLARKAYGPGVMLWVHEFNQSMYRKEAFAMAYARVLRDHAIDARSESRMD